MNDFVQNFPKGIPLAIELKHTDWFTDRSIANALHKILRENGASQVIVDKACRRDMLPMRLTTDTAFVRYVGANLPGDYDRLDDWIKKIAEWRALGLSTRYFFVHQNIDKESLLPAAHFIKNLNKKLNLSLIFLKR